MGRGLFSQSHRIFLTTIGPQGGVDCVTGKNMAINTGYWMRERGWDGLGTHGGYGMERDDGGRG